MHKACWERFCHSSDITYKDVFEVSLYMGIFAAWNCKHGLCCISMFTDTCNKTWWLRLAYFKVEHSNHIWPSGFAMKLKVVVCSEVFFQLCTGVHFFLSCKWNVCVITREQSWRNRSQVEKFGCCVQGGVPGQCWPRSPTLAAAQEPARACWWCGTAVPEVPPLRNVKLYSSWKPQLGHLRTSV